MPSTPMSSNQMPPQVSFARLPSGERLAYAAHGRGPYLVCPAWWVSHLEADWQEDGFRRLFEVLGRHRTVVRYDRIGSGLSERRRDSVELADEVDTLSFLMDHLEIPRASLFAVSCAGPPALAYATDHPERIDRLVFFGSFLRGDDVGRKPVKQAIQALVREHWGLGSAAITSLFAPDLAADESRRLSRRQRKAASPETAAALLDLTFDVDAASAAATVESPSLVLHRRGDRVVPHEAGLELAAALPNGSFQTLEGNEHSPWLGDVEAVSDAVLRFLGVEPGASPEAPREATNEMRQRPEVWTLSYGGKSVHLKDARGLHDLACLLARPGEEVHVSVLVSGAAETLDTVGADPILDDQALAEYRRRYEELEEEIAAAEDEAEIHGGDERLEALRQERQALGEELQRSVGLGGRIRRLNDQTERDRKAVSGRLRASIGKIAAAHPELGEHLEASIQTGVFCSYDPRPEVTWSVTLVGD